VLELARQAEMADFDRARPLWELTLVEGLSDGRAALLCKLHHALTDGVGGVEIAMALFDLAREGTDRGEIPMVPAVSPLSPVETLLQSVRFDVAVAGKVTRTLVSAAPRAAFTVVRRPLGSAREVADTAASIYRTVKPISSTGSPLMTERRLVRRLGVHEVPLATMKSAAKSAGGTLNDAFLAGITGGLRRYHAHHDTVVGDLHVCMPVSLRVDGDPMGGNRITLMRFDLPADNPDARLRIRETHDRAGAVRQERSLPYTQLIAGALNLMPRRYVASILRNVDVVASDVPGIGVPVFIGGAEVTMQYPFGPTIGAAVNVTLMSYVDTCAIGINVDTGAVPDFEVFHKCLVAGFDEVLALAPEPDPEPL
jgi:WS/DGAT/MGAT family acyltransferase